MIRVALLILAMYGYMSSINQLHAAELNYAEERQLRELQMERRQIQRQIRKGRLTDGDGYAISRELDGINRQINEIYRAARQRDLHDQ